MLEYFITFYILSYVLCNEFIFIQVRLKLKSKQYNSLNQWNEPKSTKLGYFSISLTKFIT